MALKKDVIKNITSDFTNEVIESGLRFFTKEEMEPFRACIQCGKCVGGCPSGRRTAWRIRILFKKTHLGLKEEVLSDPDLWNCTTCYTCQERCPRNVHTTDMVRLLRNLAVKHGHMMAPHKAVCGYFFKWGHGVPINEETRNTRKELELSEIPPTVHSYPEGVEEINKLVNETGFKKMVEEASK